MCYKKSADIGKEISIDCVIVVMANLDGRIGIVALADYLQVERCAMSAEIGILRKDGIIQCRKSHFTLL